MFCCKLKGVGFEDFEVEEIVCEGKKVEEIFKLIEIDEDIVIIVFGVFVE